MQHKLRLVSTLLLVSLAFSAPAPSSPSTGSAATPTRAYATKDPNYALWGPGDSNMTPEPMRGPLGGKVLGPQNVPGDLQNADALAPPSTDNGDVPNFKWPFSLSHNRLSSGGWSRQQNVNHMPSATDLAGVNMMLEPGAIREMHWHNTAEWAYMLRGDIRISTFTPEGHIYVGDVTAGDLWYFPAGHAHSIQAKNTSTSPDGAEFLLIFDRGTFSEDATFLLTDWLAHVPKEVIAKNFQVDISELNEIPEKELYLFKAPPPSDNIEDDMVVPNDTTEPYTYAWSKVQGIQKPGGSIKYADTRSFNVSKTISAAEVTVEVGGMRELHWHPTEPEWTYFVTGNGRMTSYAAKAAAMTLDFVPGDIAYIPPTYGHYIENTGNTTLRFLEIFKSPLVEDISLNQWLALTPANLVKAHLGFSDATIAKLSKVKQSVVGPRQ